MWLYEKHTVLTTWNQVDHARAKMKNTKTKHWLTPESVPLEEVEQPRFTHTKTHA